MWAWMDRIGITLFDATLSTAVFLTFIVLAMLACRQPARRILLARVALLASLAIVPLVGCGRLPRLDVIDTFVESRFFPRALFLAPAPADRPDDEAEVPRIIESDPVRLLPRWMAERVQTARQWLPRSLTVVDLACVAAGSAWLILGLVGVHWLIRRSRSPSPAARALFDELVAGRSWSARRARLRICSRIQHPVVTGLFRPTILIPEALDHTDNDVEPLRLSLLHEIAHAEQSDHWFSTAASMCQAVWFFLPQVWWLRAQLLIDQEFLADRSAADRYGTSSEYASSLLLLAAPAAKDEDELPERPNPGTQPAGKIGVPSALFQRMMMLLHCPYPVESRTPRVWSWTSRLAVVVASLAAACLVIRWPQASLALPTTAARPPFRVANFVVKPVPDHPGSSRTLVYLLPVALPPRFDLDVDVRSAGADLSQVRITGQPLGISGGRPEAGRPAGPFSAAIGTDDATAWHHVHIHRDHHNHLTVMVDGRTIFGPSHTDAATDWLTIEPSSRGPAEFRNLVVTW